MDLKSAVAVCLISLFSATLVVLIVRALDQQAASQLEPHLAAIAEELQAIRKQGGIAPAAVPAAKLEAVDDGLVVYYFHGNARCATCQAIESQAHQVVQSSFDSELSRGQVVWKIVNYEQPAAAQLAKKFGIQMPVVVLAKMKGGQIQDWKRLDEVWALVGDKPAFAVYVGDEIEAMLSGKKRAAREKSETSVPKPAAPTAVSSDLPLPK